MSSVDTVVAKNSFFVMSDGIERLVSEGETFAVDHPVVKASAEDSFKPFTIDNEVETATAKPGRKRNARVERTKENQESTPEKVATKGSSESDDDTKPDSAAQSGP